MAPVNTPRERREAGFAMVALLVGMAIAAIWMTAALPAWRQQAQRQREDDLIFRGEQYARAIYLYQQKNRGAYPPSIDVLVSGHYLRKKWKDPITNADFVPLGNGVSLPGTNQPAGSAPPAGSSQGPGRSGQQGNQGAAQTPGITGVRSSSTGTSIKIYQQQQQYNLWPFDARLAQLRMSRQMPQQGQPGRQGGNDRGGPGGAPGRGPQQGGPGGLTPARGGGLDRPAPPTGPGGPPGGRTGGS
ncbi:MAG TPA: type II secretion system protein [Vicinamibacterales bacterium]|nr:type II secretion system protein [Vicinamibacterales bacterium]